MPFVIELTKRAYHDMDVLFNGVKKRSGVESAERWRNGLIKRVSALEKDGNMWPLTEEPALLECDIHECIFRRWRHVYRIFFASTVIRFASTAFATLHRIGYRPRICNLDRCGHRFRR